MFVRCLVYFAFLDLTRMRVKTHFVRPQIERASGFSRFPRIIFDFGGRFNAADHSDDHLVNVKGVVEYGTCMNESDSDESEIAQWPSDSRSGSESDTPLTNSEIEFVYEHVQHAT